MLPRYLAVTPESILEVAAATFRPDNRLVLTYLPEMPPADSEAVDKDAEKELRRSRRAGRGGGRMTATEGVERDGYVVADRPTPGTPRPYDFPAIARTQLDNGLTVLVADLPGRPLVSASRSC